MSTAQHQKQTVTEEQYDKALLDKILERTVEYRAFGSEQVLKLNPLIVKKYMARPTHKGHMPTEADIMQFMMLCRSRGLDPWVGDAFLIGYDTQDGPLFSLVTSAQAMLTRAELHPQYDGIESGLMIAVGDKVQYIDGEVAVPSQSNHVIGAWARVYRKDRKIQTFRTISRAAYDKQRSLWKTNMGGMLCKCARSAALREAFPVALSGLITMDEAKLRDDAATDEEMKQTSSSLDELARRLSSTVESAKSESLKEDRQPAAETKPAKRPVPAKEPDEPPVEEPSIEEPWSQEEPKPAEVEMPLQDRLEASLHECGTLDELRAAYVEAKRQAPDPAKLQAVAEKLADAFKSAKPNGQITPASRDLKMLRQKIDDYRSTSRLRQVLEGVEADNSFTADDKARVKLWVEQRIATLSSSSQGERDAGNNPQTNGSNSDRR